MKFLITGGGGQLGREWGRYLSANNLSFSAYSSDELNITDARKATSVIKNETPDVVVNCAAYTQVDRAESESEKAYLVNSDGVKNIAEICKKEGIRMVHYSTDYVFPGNAEDQKKYPDGYPEDAETDPINMYGASKRAGEVAFKDSGVNGLLIRVSWLCGMYGSNFVKTMLRVGSERKELRVVNDQIGAPSFATDVVKKTIQLIEREEEGTVHLSSSGVISWAEFADEIFRQSNLNVKVEHITTDEYPTKAKRPAFSLLCNGKLEILRIPQIEWKQGLAELMRQLSDPTFKG